MQDILKKLEKLDAIEKAVNNLGKSLGKLEGRLHALEDSYATTKSDVEDLKESLNANEADKKTTAESLAALQKENDELCANLKLIEDKTYIWKHIQGAKALSLKTFQKQILTKRTQRWRCASWKRNWVLAMLKYREFII